MKKQLIVLLLACVSMHLSAAPVSLTQARNAATQFAASLGKKVVKGNKYLRKAAPQSASTSYYIFNMQDDGGFVIVSGDDRTEEILGYVDEGSFSADSIPSNMAYWLDSYSSAIAHLDDNTTGESTENQPQRMLTDTAKTAIAPLLTCAWNQGSPYYNQCPVIDGQYCFTGCVGTATAQVMYYHKWPQEATTTIPSYTFSYQNVQYDQPSLPSVTFDWNSMKDTYSDGETGTSADAVATLMHYVGQAIKSGFSPQGTGSGFSEVYTALRNYFYYDANLKHLYRSDYTIAQWDDIIYNELLSGRPVLYAGTSSGGAHAFVCDGYDGNGFYHINWGWGGWRNGYFRLSVLNPDDNTGIGASTSHDGYAMGQDVLVGIQPPTGLPEEVAGLKLNFTELHVDGTKVVYDCWNSLTNTTCAFDIALALLDGNGEITSVIDASRWTTASLPQNYGYVNVSFDIYNQLPAGTYRIIPVSRENGKDQWQVRNTINYVEAVVSEDKSVTLVCHPILKAESCRMTFSSVPHPNICQHVQATVKNGGDEINHTVYLFASLTDSVGDCLNRTQLVVPQGDSVTFTLYFTPTEIGTYHVWLAWDDKCENVLGEDTLLIHNKKLSTDNPVAVCYADADYKGNSVGLPVGVFDLTMLMAYGVANDDISSISVNDGYELVAYSDDYFMGDSIVLKTSVNYVGNEWNDRISSIKVRAVPTGIETITTSSSMQIQISNGMMIVRNGKGKWLSVYTINGQCLFRLFLKSDYEQISLRTIPHDSILLVNGKKVLLE